MEKLLKKLLISKKIYYFFKEKQKFPFLSFWKTEAMRRWQKISAICIEKSKNTKTPKERNLFEVLLNCTPELREKAFNNIKESLSLKELSSYDYDDLYEKNGNTILIKGTKSKSTPLLKKEIDSILDRWKELSFDFYRGCGEYTEVSKVFDYLHPKTKDCVIKELVAQVENESLNEKIDILKQIENENFRKEAVVIFMNEFEYFTISGFLEIGIFEIIFGKEEAEKLKNGESFPDNSLQKKALELWDKSRINIIESKDTLVKKIEKIKDSAPWIMKRNHEIFENLIKKHSGTRDLEEIFDLTISEIGEDTEQFTKIFFLFKNSLDGKSFTRYEEKRLWGKYNKYPKIVEVIYPHWG